MAWPENYNSSQSPQSVVIVSGTTGLPTTPGAANTDGSQDIGGVNGTSVATAANPVPSSTTPNVLATSAPTTAQTTVASGSLIAKASTGNCYGFNVVSGASAGYFMLFNSATVPADGTVTPLKVYVMAANSSMGVSWDVPKRMSAGIVGVFSTTGPFTKTASATAFIGIDYV